MKATLTRSRGSLLSVVVVAQGLALGSAFAVPSTEQAWEDPKLGVTVFRDELDPAIFWFVPQIRFESSAGKTVLRPRTLSNGNTEYSTRIIPYLSDAVRERIVADLPQIRHHSQLKAVVAKNIGISLPDFSYKYTSESASRYQYLDVARLVRLQFDPDESANFEELLGDPYGVNVAFTIVYDGVLRDKYYAISVSCKDLYQSMSHAAGAGGVGEIKKGIHLGASIEGAFRTAVQTNLGGVEIVSKGELPAMDEALRTTLEYCFDPMDEMGRRGYNEENLGDLCRGESDCLDPRGHDADYMPKVAAKGRYRFRKDVEKDNRKIGVRHVNYADALTTAVVMASLRRDAPREAGPAVVSEKKIVIGSRHGPAAPLNAGIQIETGVQYTVRAEYVVKIRGQAFAIDATAPRLDGDLYYRIGHDDWRPVDRYFTIGSDFARSGALQFYVDFAAAYRRIPAKYKLWGIPEPEFRVEVVSKRFR